MEAVLLCKAWPKSAELACCTSIRPSKSVNGLFYFGYVIQCSEFAGSKTWMQTPDGSHSCSEKSFFAVWRILIASLCVWDFLCSYFLCSNKSWMALELLWGYLSFNTWLAPWETMRPRLLTSQHGMHPSFTCWTYSPLFAFKLITLVLCSEDSTASTFFSWQNASPYWVSACSKSSSAVFLIFWGSYSFSVSSFLLNK